MNSILKIIGTEIYIGSFLFSSGLEGPAYAAKLREATELARLMEEQYAAGYEDGETAGYRSGYDEGKEEVGSDAQSQIAAADHFGL